MTTLPLETNFIFIGLIIVSAIAFVIVLFYFGAKASILRELKKSKAIPISRIKEGEYAKTLGVAKLVKAPLIAPISGRNCVFYQIIVEKKGRRIAGVRSLNKPLFRTFLSKPEAKWPS